MESQIQQEKAQMLQKLVAENDSVKKVMETLSKRQRYRTKTDLYQFRDQVKKYTGSSIDSEDLLNSFKELQNAGAGKLILKRNGKASEISRPKFEWRYSLKDVARAAGFGPPLEEKSEEAGVKKKRGRPRKTTAESVPAVRKRGRPRKYSALTEETATLPSKRVVKSTRAFVTSIQLRPNFQVRLEYPTDITKSESKMISDFVSSSLK
jgi:hypothetical protein